MSLEGAPSARRFEEPVAAGALTTSTHLLPALARSDPDLAGTARSFSDLAARRCSGRRADHAATTAADTAEEAWGRRSNALLCRQLHDIQGVVLLQPETPAREEGGPAANGYHVGFARRLRLAAARGGREGSGGGSEVARVAPRSDADVLSNYTQIHVKKSDRSHEAEETMMQLQFKPFNCTKLKPALPRLQ
jgi:hypothetical protein